MPRVLLMLLVMLLVLSSKGQSPLNYEHRSLFKQLKKMDCSRKAVLKEFPLPDVLARNETSNGRYFVIENDRCHDDASYVFVGRVNTCRSGGCVAHYGDSAAINFEYFDYFIIYDQRGHVSMVKVFRYESTHGHEITAKRWLKQFRDYGGEEDIKVGRDVDAISGATTSVYSISYDVQERTQRLRDALVYCHQFLARTFLMLDL